MIAPEQIRTIDPFSMYQSNNANKFTRLITGGQDCLLYPTPIDVIKKTDTILTITIGMAVKDDVLIEFTDTADCDCTLSDNYVIPSSFDENGYYYVVLDYSYEVKQNPNVASIKIIKPSQRESIYNTDNHLFLKCLDVSASVIIEVLDFDPDSEVKRLVLGVDNPYVLDAVDKRHDESHNINSHTDYSDLDNRINNIENESHSQTHSIESHIGWADEKDIIDAAADLAHDEVHDHDRLVPAGVVLALPRLAGIPSGYLECDGSILDGTVYTELYSYLGQRYGFGDGSADSFNLPDYRGRFLRHIDGGSNLDTEGRAGRAGDGNQNIGSTQDSANLQHNHEGQSRGSTQTPWYATYGTGKDAYGTANKSKDLFKYMGGNSGGTESRPVNISVVYAIKY